MDGGGGHELGLTRSMAKACFDRGFALLLIVVLAPVMAGCALMIKSVGTGGPVLTTEPRVDRYGREFDLLAFNVRAGRGVSGVIERHSLNHLPELFNVLRGEMSLVGPRPRPRHEAHGSSRSRNAGLRPGLTGLWALCDAVEPTADGLADLERDYAASWSLSGDIAILARTISAVRYRR